MLSSNLIQYQPRCTTFHDNFIAFCTQSETSKRVILCETKQTNAIQHNLDIYDQGLMQLKFVQVTEGVLLVLLTQTKLKAYNMQGKIMYNNQRPYQGNLADFQDRFVSLSVLDQTIHILTQQGSIFKLKQNNVQFVTKIPAKCVVMNTFNNMLLVGTEDCKVYGVKENTSFQLIKLSSPLPVYFINIMKDIIILGIISGELIITKFLNNSLQIICKTQIHIGLLSCLETINDQIFTGSDDGFVHNFFFSQNKLTLIKSINFNRIVTAIFLTKSQQLCSLYQSYELYKI